MKGVISDAMSLSKGYLRHPTDLLLCLTALNQRNFSNARGIVQPRRVVIEVLDVVMRVVEVVVKLPPVHRIVQVI